MKTSETKIEPRPAEAWRVEIDDAVLLALGEPFAWGRDDCALWVADIVRDVTGVDWAAGFRDAYRDHAGATAAMRDAGSPVLIGTVHLLAERHGWRAVEPAQAGAGCIGLVGQGDRGDGPALVIYRDAGQWVGRDECGVGYMPGELVRHAWRLPGAPAFARGGVVRAGRPFLVGERGPELVVSIDAGEVKSCRR